MCYNLISQLTNLRVEKVLNDHLFFVKYSMWSDKSESEAYLYVANLSVDENGYARMKVERSDALLGVVGEDVPFVVVGYDCSRKVFVAWNPYEIKRCILDGDYDGCCCPTKDIKQAVVENKEKEGNGITAIDVNGERVVVVSRRKLRLYMSKLNKYFKLLEEGANDVTVKVGEAPVENVKKEGKYKVVFPNGEKITDDNLVNILRVVVECAGLESVNKLEILLQDINLVSKHHYTEAQMDLGGGWYLMTDDKVRAMKDCMKKVSDRLRLGLKF